MIGTVNSLRDFGPGAAFANLADAVLAKHLDSASEKALSYLRVGGYEEALTTYGPNVEMEVYRVATWTIIAGQRGVNPADPAHVSLRLAHDDALAWFRHLAKNDARLAGEAPARRATGTASVVTGTGGSHGW